MKLRKPNNTDIELGGQESFLDLVSNILGILIILVMVAGIRAQYNSTVDSSPENAATVFAEPELLEHLSTQYEQLQIKAGHAAKLRMDIEEVEMQSEILTGRLYQQSMEYAALFDLMTTLRAEIEIAAEAQSQTLKEKIEYQRLLAETDAKLAQISQASAHLQNIKPKTTNLENIPTPLSQTVENKEMHVRLLGGRIAYVPLSELVILLRGHIGEEQQRYSRQPANFGKVGPIEQFELEFMLVTRHIPSPGGMEVQIGLQYGEIISPWEPVGEPLDLALSLPQSEFRKKLAMFQKNLYTVTVWVYSDSFEAYHDLKQFLQEQGYSVAARPMMKDHPIGISPHGTRSSTQ